MVPPVRVSICLENVVPPVRVSIGFRPRSAAPVGRRLRIATQFLRFDIIYALNVLLL